MNLYTKIFRPLLFTLPPESAHLLTEFLLSHFPQSTKIFHNKKTLDSKKTLGRISINNPLGLAAGFDKNCTMLKALENLGFGYLVGGTIVKNPQPGNPKPRIIRKTNQSSLINSLGFPSSGLNKVINNLEKGRDLIFDIDWQGTQQIKEQKLKYKLITFFILPPSKKELF